ncbi:MAG: DUF6252 family protein [Bacteroidota bacterium]
MKIARTIALLLIAVTLFDSCNKKKDPEPEPAPVVPTINGSMTANLNGNSWTSVKNYAELLIDDTDQISAIAINGETADNMFVWGIDFPTADPNIAVGNHDMGLTRDDAVMIYVKKTANGGTLIEHSPDEGTINITAVDNVNKKISGTFTLLAHKIGSTAAADSIKITNGVFTNISFTTRHQQ